ncbi:hypothetical protein [Streptomyces sp. NEAU-H3]|uniref:hypothetical protein n=1 Tax=Streptomyces sp. NEAU-H3 TaxID=2720636 RepID=UPI001438DF0F|nr:hypothetical protein [Streptomyces sp. NEAU-H3]NJA56679.1 hypothetical protein [Streptomyces sp. NEAU-H3]
MTASSILVIDCDGPDCDEQTHWATAEIRTHAELRAIRRRDGWTTRRQPGGGPLLDLCPTCAKDTTR